MTNATAAAPLTLNIIDLASIELNMAESREIGYPIRDYRTVRVLTRGALHHQVIPNLQKLNPGYTCVGINSYPLVADEF